MIGSPQFSMPLSIDHFKTAATRYPNAEALVSLPEEKGITSAKAPRMGLLSIFGIGNYFDELEKSRSIVKDFKAALIAKYGKEVTDFAFPAELETEAATSSLKSGTVAVVLKKAELLDLLTQAITDSITDEEREPEPADSPFQNMPGLGQRIFPKETIESIKEAYYDGLKEASKLVFGESGEFHFSSLPSVQKAQRLVKADLERAGFGQFSSLVSEYFSVKAMRAAMETNSNVREAIAAPLKPPVSAEAAYIDSPQRPAPMVAASIADSPEAPSSAAEAVRLSSPQRAVPLHDPEWNI